MSERQVRLGCAGLLVFVFAPLFAPSAAQEAKGRGASVWERSIVTIEVARKHYEYYQPWSTRTKQVSKTGTVIGEHQILTTAEDLWERTLVRLQKGGRGPWSIGQVTWIDYPANLALVTTPDTNFWQGLKPATLGSGKPADGGLQIMRWRDGNLETRRAEFTQFSVREGQLSSLEHAELEASSEIQAAGWGEPMIANSRILGLVRAQDGRNCIAIPASFIQSILSALQKRDYHGLGYFNFYWEPAVNLESLQRLKLPGEPRGVIVIDVPARPDGWAPVLKPQDIILRIDGFDLDIQGDYKDPELGHLMLENLAMRRKWAGDEVKMQIWREGQQMDVTYRLPHFDYTNSLVPYANYDQEPEYLIAGGLVFQPLLDSYLASWGPEWKQRAPFRLNYYNNQHPTHERPALVILSQVLPDPFNIGYQEQKCLVVDKVNGQPIRYLSELREALQKPVGDYNVIEFVAGDSLRRIVVEAGQTEREATARVLRRYGISQSSRLASVPKPEAQKAVN